MGGLNMKYTEFKNRNFTINKYGLIHDSELNEYRGENGIEFLPKKYINKVFKSQPTEVKEYFNSLEY